MNYIEVPISKTQKVLINKEFIGTVFADEYGKINIELMTSRSENNFVVTTLSYEEVKQLIDG